MNKCLPCTLATLLLLGACGSVSDQRPEPVRKSEYYLEHGVSAFEESNYISATDFLRKALAHYRSIDDSNGILMSRINLAETSIAAGNFNAALGHIEAAESIAQEPAYSSYRPRLALLRAEAHWRNDEEAKALEILTSLIPQFDEQGHSKEKPDLIMLGATTLRTDIAFSHLQDEVAAAETWLRRLGIMLAATADSTPLHEARLLRFEAQLAYSKGDPKTALVKLDEALVQYRLAATRPAIAATLTESGEILMQQERLKEAEDRLQRALYIRLWMTDRHGAREVMKHLHHLYLKTGQQMKAEQIAVELRRLETKPQEP